MCSVGYVCVCECVCVRGHIRCRSSSCSHIKCTNLRRKLHVAKSCQQSIRSTCQAVVHFIPPPKEPSCSREPLRSCQENSRVPVLAFVKWKFPWGTNATLSTCSQLICHSLQYLHPTLQFLSVPIDSNICNLLVSFWNSYNFSNDSQF